MKKLHFSVVIQAPREHVWSTVIGPETFKAWTAPFCEGSCFEGSWSEGGRIRFLTPDGSGMTAVIAQNRPHEYISIQHLGCVSGGVDEKDSEMSRKWAHAFENYTFVTVPDGTEFRVDVDTPPDFEQFMLETWPKALDRLKAVCEARSSAVKPA